jgi:hypothetical protein
LPSKDPDQLSKSEAAKRRDETIRRMIATPPLKHADEKHPRKKPPKKKAAKKRKTKRKDPG